MNSIKELKEQLGYEEIGLDDIFVFHCTQCGKCCIHREDILLSPKDLFHIAKKLKITPEVALAQYCETYLGRNSHIPVVRLKPQGSVKRCPLLKNQKCLVHDVKPAVCAMFPIGRYLALPSDGIFPENPEELSVGYVFNDPECGDRSETHTVREWFHKFNIPLKDDYFFAWTKTKATLSKHLRFLEGRLSEKTMVSIWNSPCGTSSRCHQFYFIPAFFLIDIQDDLQNRCFSGSRSSSNNADRVCKNHTYCFFLLFG